MSTAGLRLVGPSAPADVNVSEGVGGPAIGGVVDSVSLGPVGRRRLPVPRPTGPSARVLLVTVFLCLVAGLAIELSRRVPPPQLTTAHLSWLALAGLFAATEMYVLHLQVRRESQTVSLSEIPLALGLLLAGPLGLLVGRMLGAICVFVFYRRQRPLKVAYNSALTLADTAVALLVFKVVLGGGAILEMRSWLAMYAALAIAGSLDAVATTLVISFYEGGVRPRDAVKQAMSAVPTSAVLGTVALGPAYALVADPRSAWALVASAMAVILGYRAYASLRERHVSLERLYRFSDAVGSSADIDGVLHSVLLQANELLRSEQAEIAFFPDGPGAAGVLVRLGPGARQDRQELADGHALDELTTNVMLGGASMLLSRKSKDPDVRGRLRRGKLQEAIVVPLRGETEVFGALTVADRLGQVRTFDQSDVRLLEAVASHASAALTKRRLVDQLRYDALHDALTGLPNRTCLRRDLQQALVGLGDGEFDQVAVMIMDLDGFKDINDALGHHQGDLLLQEIAARMFAVAPGTAALARLGGDEFAILLPGVADVTEAELAGHALLAALEPPCVLDGINVEIRASIGVAIAPEDGTDAPALLKRADIAMYAAKANDRGVQVFGPELQSGVPHRLALSGELRSGIGLGQLAVYVQPQACLTTGEVLGVEALVRWQHPTHGLLQPDEFIAMAERSGLIKPLTMAVLDTALAANASWRALGVDIGISVNLSARSLIDPQLADDVARLLVAHNVPAEALTLEITESAAMTDTGRAVRALHRFAEMGVRMSIDDFGTGQTSLAYLRRLKVREIKIDKSFVIGMVANPDDAVIVKAIIDLGANLGLDVVAEGVEGQVVWDRLKAIGAATAQGYHLGRPMHADGLIDWLRHHDLYVRPLLAIRGRGAA